MKNSGEPIDLGYERDKAKAAISKTVVMSDAEKEAAYRNIDAEFDDREAQRRRTLKEEQDEFNARIDAQGEGRSQMALDMGRTIKEAERNQREENAVATRMGDFQSPEALHDSVDQITPSPALTATAQVAPSDQEKSNQTQSERPSQVVAQVRGASRHTVSAKEVHANLPLVATPLKFTIESAVAQIDIFREEVRKSNELGEVREELLEHLDKIRHILVSLFQAVPENVESVSSEDAKNVAGWLERFRAENAVSKEKYLSPEAVNRSIYPTGLVLTCAGIGATFGGVLGAGAGVGVGATVGTYIGNTLANNMKPNELTDNIVDRLNTNDAD